MSKGEEKRAADLQTPASIWELDRSQVPHHLLLPGIAQRDFSHVACDQESWNAQTYTLSHTETLMVTSAAFSLSQISNDSNNCKLSFHLRTKADRTRWGGGGDSQPTWEQEQRSTIVSSPVAVLSLEVTVEVHTFAGRIHRCACIWGCRHKPTLLENNNSHLSTDVT